MKQIALPLLAASDRASRLVVGNANAHVVDALLDTSRWPFHTAILSGPPRSGKSLFAQWFVESGQGDAIDNAHKHDEAEIFHAWNRAQQSGRPLLLVSDRPFGHVGEDAARLEAANQELAGGHAMVDDGGPRWTVTLPDLGSRLGAALPLAIDEPDDELLAGLIALHAETRGLILDHAASQYLAGRCERSHLGVEQLVAAIDRLSLERKQPPTLAVWREALDETKGGVKRS